ncbi:DeoR/GlpR family DNA-binding transcription regulator, partial [Streptomyces sp. SM12]
MDGRANLLAGQRRSLILAEVRRAGGARVSELTALLGVSDMTVRRDLDALARQGALRKVHGGAVAAEQGPGHEPGFAAKSELLPEAKRRIARVAATEVPPGSVVALSAGTTTHAVARELLAVPELTVVTNSLPVSDVFHAAPGAGERPVPVVLTGGVRTPSDALVGPVADAALAALHVDVLLLGAHGLDARAGLTTPNLAEAETNRHLVRS